MNVSAALWILPLLLRRILLIEIMPAITISEVAMVIRAGPLNNGNDIQPTILPPIITITISIATPFKVVFDNGSTQ